MRPPFSKKKIMQSRMPDFSEQFHYCFEKRKELSGISSRKFIPYRQSRRFAQALPKEQERQGSFTVKEGQRHRHAVPQAKKNPGNPGFFFGLL